MSDPDDRPAGEASLARVAANRQYVQLVRERARFSWTLTAIMLAVFFGYILLIAFERELLARIVIGRATTLGIPLGVGVILVGILLTALYVRRANGRFDALTREIVEQERP